MRAVRLGSYSMCATLAGTPSLSAATEVDDAVGALVAATLVPGGDAALVVAAALLRQRRDQRLLRLGPGDLDEVGHARATTARRRRLVLADSHRDSFVSAQVAPVRRPGRRRCRCGHRRRRMTMARLVLARCRSPGACARACPGGCCVFTDSDPDAEDLLDGDLDLGLVRVGVDDERVLVLVEEPVALLGDDGRDQDVAGVGDPHSADSFSLSLASASASWRSRRPWRPCPCVGPARNASSAPGREHHVVAARARRRC